MVMVVSQYNPFSEKQILNVVLDGSEVIIKYNSYFIKNGKLIYTLEITILLLIELNKLDTEYVLCINTSSMQTFSNKMYNFSNFVIVDINPFVI